MNIINDLDKNSLYESNFKTFPITGDRNHRIYDSFNLFPFIDLFDSKNMNISYKYIFYRIFKFIKIKIFTINIRETLKYRISILDMELKLYLYKNAINLIRRDFSKLLLYQKQYLYEKYKNIFGKIPPEYFYMNQYEYQPYNFTVNNL